MSCTYPVKVMCLEDLLFESRFNCLCLETRWFITQVALGNKETAITGKFSTNGIETDVFNSPERLQPNLPYCCLCSQSNQLILLKSGCSESQNDFYSDYLKYFFLIAMLVCFFLLLHTNVHLIPRIAYVLDKYGGIINTQKKKIELNHTRLIKSKILVT